MKIIFSEAQRQQFAPVCRDYRVSLLLNGREIPLETFKAASRHDAINQCKAAIQHSGNFKLFATEVEE